MKSLMQAIFDIVFFAFGLATFLPAVVIAVAYRHFTGHQIDPLVAFTITAILGLIVFVLMVFRCIFTVTANTARRSYNMFFELKNKDGNTRHRYYFKGIHWAPVIHTLVPEIINMNKRGPVQMDDVGIQCQDGEPIAKSPGFLWRLSDNSGMLDKYVGLGENEAARDKKISEIGENWLQGAIQRSIKPINIPGPDFGKKPTCAIVVASGAKEIDKSVKNEIDEDNFDNQNGFEFLDFYCGDIVLPSRLVAVKEAATKNAEAIKLMREWQDKGITDPTIAAAFAFIAQGDTNAALALLKGGNSNVVIPTGGGHGGHTTP